MNFVKEYSFLRAYVRLFKKKLILILNENCGKKYIVQKDNASPDCNPIENLLGILASKVCDEGSQFSSVSDLRNAID